MCVFKMARRVIKWMTLNSRRFEKRVESQRRSPVSTGRPLGRNCLKLIYEAGAQTHFRLSVGAQLPKRDKTPSDIVYTLPGSVFHVKYPRINTSHGLYIDFGNNFYIQILLKIVFDKNTSNIYKLTSKKYQI